MLVLRPGLAAIFLGLQTEYYTDIHLIYYNTNRFMSTLNLNVGEAMDCQREKPINRDERRGKIFFGVGFREFA